MCRGARVSLLYLEYFSCLIRVLYEFKCALSNSLFLSLSRRTWALGPCLRNTWYDDSLLSPVHLAVLLLQFQLFCLRLWNADLFTGRATCPRPAVFNSLETAGAVEIFLMIGYEKSTEFTPEVLTWCTLDNYCNYYYYLAMLVIYEHLNILAMFVIISTRHCPKRIGHPSEPGSSLGFFLSFGLCKEFFLATVLLHLHCLLFGVLGWVSVQQFEISADVRRAI